MCLGLPGTLPILNEQAVEYALRVAMALDCEVPERSMFHRKNYFYPDMPKNYQISQYDLPMCGSGAGGRGRRRATRRHHPGAPRGGHGQDHPRGRRGRRIHDADYSLVDFNRAGVPLVEIVSEPDIRSPEHARAYVTELRACWSPWASPT